MTDSIDADGYPLAFKIREGQQHSMLHGAGDGADVIKVEARQLTGHQKEAVVTEGEAGSVWRMTSDEGPLLNGTDLAPFPLGFFNAALQGDLLLRIRGAFAAKRQAPPELGIECANFYGLSGSFALGTGQGHAQPAEFRITVESGEPAAEVARSIRQALQNSPALAWLRTPLHNRFALYINGRRRSAEGIAESAVASAADPFMTYRAAPQPLAEVADNASIIKSDRREGSDVEPASSADPAKIRFNVRGRGSLAAAADCADTDTWLQRPNSSHFLFRSAAVERADAPSALALMSAGIAFCYMTQLARYIDTMKLAIHGVRLVQTTPYRVQDGHGAALPIDTHLFLNGNAPEETHLKLLQIAARTCYLHVTAAASLEPVIEVTHNGVKLNIG